MYGECMGVMSDPVIIERPELVTSRAIAALSYRDAIKFLADFLAIATPWLMDVARMRIPAIARHSPWVTRDA